MSVPFLMIDGYNLLHSAGLALAKYAPGDLQRQRERLLTVLVRGLTPDERKRCTIVFDAIDAPGGLASQYEREGIAIRFAKPGHEADELIEELILNHPQPRQLLVVSGDKRVQTAARLQRGSVLDSDAFLKRLDERAQAVAAAKTVRPTKVVTPKSSADTTAEVSHWMREFGAIDVEALAAEDDPQSNVDRSDPWQRNIDDLQRMLDSGEGLDTWLDPPKPG